MGEKNQTLKQKTEIMLRKYGLYAKKKFGQNFLIDESVLDEIIKNSDVHEDDLVIEIGPGLGNLTEKLINRKAMVIAFEIDKDMIEVLEKRFEGVNNFLLVEADILKVDLNQYIEKFKKKGSIKVVANLPYYITTPIIFKILEQNININDMIIMVQKEVADRMVAKTNSKDYGVLTVMMGYYGIVSKMFDVTNTSFIPPPNVTSSVVKIIINKQYDIECEKIFFDLVKRAFSQRRKKAVNSLENNKFMNMTKKEIENIFIENEIPLTSRAEEISIEKFVQIATSINKSIDKI